MKIKYYVKIKILYNSGKIQRFSSYNGRIEDESQIDNTIDEILETVHAVYRDATTAYINVGDTHINIAETASFKIVKKYVFW